MKKLGRCLGALILSIVIVLASMPSVIYAYTYAADDPDKSGWKLKIEKNNNSYSYGSYLYSISEQNTGGGSYTFTGTLFDNDVEQWKKEGICLKSDVAGWSGTLEADRIRIYDNTSALTKAMYYGFSGAYGITDENNYAAKWAENYIRDTLEQRYINVMVSEARSRFDEDKTAEADAAAAEAEALAVETLKSMSTNELLSNTGLTHYGEALTTESEVYLNDVAKLEYLFTHHGGTLAKRNYDDGLSDDQAWVWAWEGAIDSGEYVSGNTCLISEEWTRHRAVGYVQSYIMEVNQLSVPKGVYTVVAEGGADQDIGFLVISPIAQECSLEVYKQGEALVSWNGTNFEYSMQYLIGATFRVTAAENILLPDGTIEYTNGAKVADITTNEDGKAVLNNIHPGTYKVQEISAPEGYVLNDTIQTITIAPDQSAEVAVASLDVTNSRKKASVYVTKKDVVSQYGLSGTEFTIYAANDIKNASGAVIVNAGTALQTVTATSGTAAFTVDLPYGNTFTIKETKARTGYILSEEPYTFSFDQVNETITNFTHEYTNERVKGKLSIIKNDSETTSAQGDATLCGAVYGLYASEDIISPDGSGEVLYRRNDLLGTLTTDTSGISELVDIPLGNYYLKEISSSEGYLLDPLIHDVSFVYEGGAKKLVSKNLTLNEKVKKQAFQLIKVSGSGDELQITDKAGFTAYLKSALKQNDDGSYDFENSTPVIIGKNGETTLYTDETGYLCTIPLPYGIYMVRETVVPAGLSPIAPFTVNVTENSTDPQPWRVFVDQSFSAKIKIVKKDRITGKNVLKAGTEFQVYEYDAKTQKRGKLITMTVTYPSSQVLTSFKVDEAGELLLPEPLPDGTYAVYEVTAPYGYMLDPEPIIVTLAAGNAYETDGITNDVVVTAESRNYPVVGEIKIVKQGEVLKGYQNDFSYEAANLAGAVFEVYAAEDILTPDNQKDKAGEVIVLHHKGDLIDTVTTDENGYALISNLYLGSYDIKEVSAPEGYLVKDETQKVTLSYIDQYTPVVSQEVIFLNQRQMAKMQAVKTDAETGEKLSGAEFGIYAYEDIRNVAGDLIVSKDMLIEKAVSDDLGVVDFKKDYPFATYYIKEITPPDGYLASDDIYIFKMVPYAGTPVILLRQEIANVSSKVIIHKTDVKGAELTGATLSIQDKEGNTVETWTSNGEEHVIRGLSIGETYTLKEEFAPYGYLRAKEIEFTVENSRETQNVTMRDLAPTGVIIINKDGEVLDDITVLDPHWYDFIYKKKSLSGVTFEVYNAENILVDTIVTNELGIASLDNLELGEYYLIETKAKEGFLLNSDPIKVKIDYINQDTPIITANMTLSNERQKVSVLVSKKDAETDKPLAGAIISLYSAEDILSDSGKVLIENGAEIAQVVTGEDGTAVFSVDLPLGNYVVREKQAPEGYMISEQEYLINASFKEDVEFQQYLFEFWNTQVDEEEPDEPDIPKSVKTGDSTHCNLWFCLWIASASVLLYQYREWRKGRYRKIKRK